MTAYLRVHVVCNFPGCYCRFESYDATMTDARASAAKSGWSRVAGLDFCGKPEQALGWAADEKSKDWRGHSSQKDHLPATKSIVKGEVRLSCSCGWVYEPEHKWQRGCALSLVEIRWGQHVKTAIEAVGDE